MRGNFSDRDDGPRERGGWTQSNNGRGYRQSREGAPSTALGTYVPPNSIEAEQSTLGAMLIDRNAIDLVSEYLSLDDFYRDTHRTIYDVIVQLRRADAPVDLITVQEELKNRDKLEVVGGISYLTSLFETVPTAANSLYYAKIVQDKAVLRQLVAVGHEIIGMARGEIEDVNQTVEQCERALFSVSASRRRGVGPVSLKSLVAKAIPMPIDGEPDPVAESDKPIELGYEILDKKVKARPGRLIIIGARPSVGKTSLALSIALNIAKCGKTVVFFSIELPAEELIIKLVATAAEVNFDNLADGHLTDDEWVRVQSVIDEIYELPFYIDDSTSSASGMRAVCRQMAASDGGLGAAFVDYLQLMNMPNKFDKQVDAINYTCKELKGAGKEIGVPVFLLSQLNRGLERREGAVKRPCKSDLREGGEEPADIIMLIHRPESSAPKVAGDIKPPGYMEDAEIIIDKQRNGWTGAVRLGFKADFAKFVDKPEDNFLYDPSLPTPI